MKPRSYLLLGLFSTHLIGCSSSPQLDSGPDTPIDVSHVKDAVPRYEVRTRAGNPPTYNVLGSQYYVLAESTGYQKRGIASWYGRKFHGRKTANGEIYDMYAMTAAHKTLPIPSYVRVVNLNNKRSVILRVNDRGPFKEGRIIDLSYAAAVKLGIDKTGTAPVEVTAIEPGGNTSPQSTPITTTVTASTAHPVYLKVGAFHNMNNATQLQNKLTQAALPVRATRTADPNGNGLINRVYVGPITSAAKVQQTQKQLQSLGIQRVQVIRTPIPKTPSVVQ